MKPFSLLLLAIAIGLCACRHDRVPILEKRVTDLEAKVKTLEDIQKAKSDVDARKEARFNQCVSIADEDLIPPFASMEPCTEMVPMIFTPAACRNFNGKSKTSWRSASSCI